MKTNIKLDKRNKSARPLKKKARVKKPKSNPLPIILISLGAFILIIIMLLVGSNNKKAKPQNTVVNNPETKIRDSKPPIAKIDAKTTAKETKNAKKEAPESSGPELVGYSSNVLKPKGDAEASADEPEEVSSEVTSKPTESKAETVAPSSNLPPKEQSIANLKKIGKQYKEYAANKQGHMPLALYQLDLNESDKVSPLTNKQYVMTQDGKGSFLKDSLEAVIVREAEAVNGKYLCLLGNGEVREIDAGSIED